jgi:hypothetical protein
MSGEGLSLIKYFVVPPNATQYTSIAIVESIIDFQFSVIHMYPYSENAFLFVCGDRTVISFRRFDSLALVV